MTPPVVYLRRLWSEDPNRVRTGTVGTPRHLHQGMRVAQRARQKDREADPLGSTRGTERRTRGSSEKNWVVSPAPKSLPTAQSAGRSGTGHSGTYLHGSREPQGSGGTDKVSVTGGQRSSPLTEKGDGLLRRAV